MWLVLTFGDDRQYAGNSGYDDEPTKWFSYDSFVANHRQVKLGDSVVLCDRHHALGVARIEKLDSGPSIKSVNRCPSCRITTMKRRKNLLPAYRCNRGHEFDEPVQEGIPCTKFTAHFGSTFTQITGHLDRTILRQGCPRYSDQLAMQEFEFSRVRAALRQRDLATAELIERFSHGTYPPAGAAESEIPSSSQSYLVNNSDERERINRQIYARRGQQSFRDGLRRRYGDQCMISGCKVLDVLEAAHIRPYRGPRDNHLGNGLLLRADLHTLFDLDLIGIEPLTLRVHVHPTIVDVEYRKLEGSSLSCAGRRPSEVALKSRWESYCNR